MDPGYGEPDAGFGSRVNSPCALSVDLDGEWISSSALGRSPAALLRSSRGSSNEWIAVIMALAFLV